MRNLFKSILLISFISISIQSFSQTDDLLTDLPKDTKDGYVKSEKKLINTVNWLETSPYDKDVDFRKKELLRMSAWLINTPTVDIVVDSKIVHFSKENSELTLIFMGGWAKYSIENAYSKDLVKCNLAGLQTIIRMYKKGNVASKKEEYLDQLVELDKNNELEKWVTEQLNKKK